MNENHIREDLARLDAKLDRIQNVQARQGEKLTKSLLLQDQNVKDLKEHMRRTKAAEERLDKIEKGWYIAMGAIFMASLFSNKFAQVLTELIKEFK